MRVWLEAARPRTLTAALAPVVMGTAIAAREGAVHVPSAIAALFGALLIQIGTNLANDYFDFRKGADTRARIGPPRASASGLVASATMRRAFIGTFIATAPIAIYLAARGGWPIALIGVFSIAAGILYTGGPRPLGYLGLGEILVLVFFGPVAVAGTHYVQALRPSPEAIVAGVAPGLLATALLVVNNLRDLETDRRAGKRTLAVRFGRTFAKAEIIGGVGLAAVVPVVLLGAFDAPAGVLTASAACVLAIPALTEVVRTRSGERLDRPLGAMGRTLALYGVAFSLGYVL